MKIKVSAMQRPGADAPSDDWSGITDPVVRRMLQNRCNQRAARRKKAAVAAAAATASVAARQGWIQEVVVSGSGDYFCLATINGVSNGSLSSSSYDSSAELLERAEGAAKWFDPRPDLGSLGGGDGARGRPFASLRWAAGQCSPTPALPYAAIAQRFADEASRTRGYQLPADHLLSLIYYNVYRGVIEMVAILGLDLDMMNLDDYPSPFLPMSQTASSAITRLPPNLRPTEIQQRREHHPQWDLWPDPQVRDNAICYPQDLIDDDELCLEMVGSQSRLGTGSSDQAGVYIWGQPWLTSSWEVTPHFVRKYPWLFSGSSSLEISTNYWRRKRGEKPISFAKLTSREGSGSPDELTPPCI
jgi:hypothetical protein